MTASSNSPRVLIVDDVPSNIRVLASILSDNYDISFATSGSEALQLLSEQNVDIILLDIVMPEMNGYWVLEQIKSNTKIKDIPIIFLTSRNTAEDEVHGLQMGAADYITKPFAAAVVKARVNTQLALQRMNRQLAEITEELLTERQFIELVVQNMVGPEEIQSPHMRYWMQPVEKTSGDLLMVAENPNGIQYYFLGDITGHGLSSAVVGPIISYIFYSMTDRGSSLVEIVNELNHYLVSKLPPNVFLTGCFISINSSRDTMEIWNCAMPDTLVFRENRLFARLLSRFQPLGIINGPFGNPETLSLAKNDRIFFLSDGLVEVYNAQGQEFGIDRLAGVIATMVEQDKPLQYIHSQLVKFNDSGRQKDDMTIAEIFVS
ncbi:MAG: response regulator receiver protein [Magnetococcales bacterium]|nr:response regulator receiver protein [Magnetococcales bacterium]HIJ84180.1 fused response regulator/phosphatase [Magnetococcales bacterium]